MLSHSRCILHANEGRMSLLKDVVLEVFEKFGWRQHITGLKLKFFLVAASARMKICDIVALQERQGRFGTLGRSSGTFT